MFPAWRRSLGVKLCCKPAPEVHGFDRVYVQPDVFALEHIDIDNDVLSITGPPWATHMVTKLQGVRASVRRSEVLIATQAKLGPLAQTTLDAPSRERAGIPLNAEFFAFVYPHDAHPSTAMAMVNEVVGAVEQHGRHTDPSLFLQFLLLGGFIYLDKDRRLLRLNGLSFRQSAAKVLPHCVYPHPHHHHHHHHHRIHLSPSPSPAQPSLSASCISHSPV